MFPVCGPRLNPLWPFASDCAIGPRLPLRSRPLARRLGSAHSEKSERSLAIDARIAEDLQPGDRRGQRRAPVSLDAHVRELGSTGTEARVLNISADGFMAETEAEYEVGARVWLILPGRERASAVVRWTAAGKLGAQFAEPLSEEALAQIGS